MLSLSGSVTVIYELQNETYQLQVSEIGAELQSLCSKKTGREFIWSGDPAVWSGRSPILFPIIGRLLNDKYRLNGTQYTMPKHGLVRREPFSLVGKTDTELTLCRESDENSLRQYPFRFRLTVTYTLLENGLSVAHTVTNLDAKPLLFSFGAHPGFACEVGDKLVFEQTETADTERIDDDTGVLSDERFPLLQNENTITITAHSFDHDALILSNLKSRYVTLVSDRRPQQVRFFFDSPLLGIWAKPGAPYVCLEPWWGIDDDAHEKADFSQKRGIMTLPAGLEKTFCWKAEIHHDIC
jgi:galactose mutarotase-like enzyme